MHLQGRYPVRAECMWPISDAAAAAAVQVFKAQLLNQHNIASISAGTAIASTAGTANATPSTSVQVCSGSPLQTLHFPGTSACLLICTHFTLCVEAIHNLCLSDIDRFWNALLCCKARSNRSHKLRLYICHHLYGYAEQPKCINNSCSISCVCIVSFTVLLHMTCKLRLTYNSHLVSMNRALSHTPMEMSTLENSKTARGMGRARLGVLIGVYMTANGTMIRDLGRAHTPGLMVLCMRATGRMT